MEYTVNQLAQMSGVSSRTLRYYHEIGLLNPKRISSSGYRIYGAKEVDRLQHILLYREMGIGLDHIGSLLDAPSFDRLKVLKEHKNQLIEKRLNLELLIENVEKTIASAEGKIIMSDNEKFEGFKKQMLDRNEKSYGSEIREKYGEEVVDQSNLKFLKMTQADYQKVQTIEKEMFEELKEGIKSKDPKGEHAQKAALLHKQWLSFYWDTYNEEAHAGLAQMYVDDERFKAYYDKAQPGTAEFLRDAVLIFTGVDGSK
ncbi:MAG TPA: MerR family transcriptional regulator [Clostridiales bacterium]|nr:MerR family transcriptional regulator [Clostridiales bacterium]